LELRACAPPIIAGRLDGTVCIITRMYVQKDPIPTMRAELGPIQH
jgi:hypothetical protein